MKTCLRVWADCSALPRRALSFGQWGLPGPPIAGSATDASVELLITIVAMSKPNSNTV